MSAEAEAAPPVDVDPKTAADHIPDVGGAGEGEAANGKTPAVEASSTAASDEAALLTHDVAALPPPSTAPPPDAGGGRRKQRRPTLTGGSGLPGAAGAAGAGAGLHTPAPLAEEGPAENDDDADDAAGGEASDAKLGDEPGGKEEHESHEPHEPHDPHAEHGDDEPHAELEEHAAGPESLDDAGGAAPDATADAEYTPPGDAGAGDWEQYHDDDSNTPYWYNATTGDSTYEDPTAAAAAADGTTTADAPARTGLQLVPPTGNRRDSVLVQLDLLQEIRDARIEEETTRASNALAGVQEEGEDGEDGEGKGEGEGKGGGEEDSLSDPEALWGGDMNVTGVGGSNGPDTLSPMDDLAAASGAGLVNSDPLYYDLQQQVHTVRWGCGVVC